MNGKNIGQRILARRKELLIPQRQLAQLAKVSSATISLWESDKTSPRGLNLHNLAIALQCSAEWILHGNADVSPPPAIIAETILTDDELEMLALYRTLPESEKLAEIQSLKDKSLYFKRIFEELKSVNRRTSKNKT